MLNWRWNQGDARRSLSMPKTYRIAHTVIVLLVLMLSCIDWISYPTANWYSTTVAIIVLIGIIAMLFCPLSAGLLLLGIDALCAVYNTVGGPSRLWSTALGAGAIASCIGTVLSLVIVVLVECMIQFVQSYYLGSSIDEISIVGNIVIISMVFLAALLGLFMNNMMRQQRIREREYMHNLDRQTERHKVELLDYALHMHDHVLGLLVNVALAANRHIESHSSNAYDRESAPDLRDESGDWALVYEQTSSAIRDIHHIVRHMSSLNVDDRKVAAITNVIALVRSNTRNVNSQLSEQGFHGGFRSTMVVSIAFLWANVCHCSMM